MSKSIINYLNSDSKLINIHQGLIINVWKNTSKGKLILNTVSGKMLKSNSLFYFFKGSHH